MNTRTSSPFEVEVDACPVDDTGLRGVEQAVGFARSGRLISAIKHLELANPGLAREEAKTIVRSFGYGRVVRWPEPEKLPVRRL